METEITDHWRSACCFQRSLLFNNEEKSFHFLPPPLHFRPYFSFLSNFSGHFFSLLPDVPPL